MIKFLSGSASNLFVVGSFGGSKHHDSKARRPFTKPGLEFVRYSEEPADHRGGKRMGKSVDEIERLAGLNRRVHLDFVKQTVGEGCDGSLQ